VTDETSREALERGKKEGRIDALLEEHSAHLAKINGSVADAAKALDGLSTEIHTLSRDSQRALDAVERELRAALRLLGDDIRTLNEELRLRDERVSVAAGVLAKETERRREELAASVETTDRTTRSNEVQFSRRQQLVALAIATGLTIAGLVLAHPWGGG
jgi:hypothetical protein